MSILPESALALERLEPKHDFLVGIDSDGCAFDTMEVKHKECFIPAIVKYWSLQPVSKYAREAAEFVNLYSKWRGINRWPALVMVLDLLRKRPEVRAREFDPPLVPSLREFIADTSFPKSNDGLRAFMAHRADDDLATALAWTVAVNEAIAAMVHGVPPFPNVRKSLAALTEKADMIVVSATPVEALRSEWQEHGIADFVRAIAGQEMGSKTQHLGLVGAKYEREKILMIGDALGDLKAARANHALFYPIKPGDEEASWRRFHDEAMHRFLAGTFAGPYERELVAEFEALLPEVPPWTG